MEWTCNFCTVVNFNKLNVCETCYQSQPGPITLPPEELGAFGSQTEGGNMVELESAEWTCKFCTVVNFNKLNVCETCYQNQPEPITQPPEELGAFGFKTEDGNTVELESAVWQCERCYYLNAYENHFCERCGVDGGRQNIADTEDEAAPSNDFHGWICDDCEYYNYIDDKYCEFCQGFRDDDIPVISFSKYSLRHQPNVYQEGKYYKSKLLLSNSPEANMAEDAERIMLLIGKTGSGKSATGNGILGKKAFYSSACPQSVTSKCQLAHAERFGRKITVVDTPGLFDTRTTNAAISNEIVKCTEMILPGPHAVILVIRLGRFTEEEQDTVKQFADHFGEYVFRYMIVLFTGKDDLEQDNTPIEEFINSSPPALVDLITKCGNRYIAFNNTADDSVKERQTQDLIVLINQMLFENGGHFFTNDMLKEAGENLRKRLLKIAEAEEEKQNRETEKIKREERRKYRKESNERMVETDRLYAVKLTREWENEDSRKERRRLKSQKERLENELRNARRRLDK